MNKVILQDYFDLSISDKLKEYEKKMDDNSNKLQNQISGISDNINKLDYETKIKNLENYIDAKFNAIEFFLNKLENKITQMNNSIEKINQVTTKIDNNLKDSINNSGTLEYHRKLNAAIRKQVPVSFCTSKAIDNLNKLNIQ
ncbi:hypothetical protein Catovirus_2_70 [Catovirus CTV1]|uniref:Uncharacterized protein n=1 Tax=Catovirus CTV1 TaxID=1977631 RepID=A0A1V0SBR6_9VIRU|nr:hypothetical protein Catovirus_2_70 [Catovirus CTV1]